MRVKCIDNCGGFSLTIGKLYDAMLEDTNGYTIMNNDNGHECWYLSGCFELLSKSEIRNEKIDKLLEL